MELELPAGMRIAVAMGGPGSEREVSLRSGEAVSRALESLGASVVRWDVRGPDFVIPPGTDLVYNMVHGTFGEDGGIQECLDRLGIPYTGEGAAASRRAFDKIETKIRFDEAGVPTARWCVLAPDSGAPGSPPFVLKAPRQGSSVGVHIVRTPCEFRPAMADCARYDREILLEEYFPGTELTVGILGGEALPIVEIVPVDGFYDYEHKYTKGASEYFVPARISDEATAAVQAAALAAYRSLELEVYCRADVLLAADGSLNVLEVNTIPGMTETSLLPKAAAAAGIDFPSLCARIAHLSLRRFEAGQPVTP